MRLTTRAFAGFVLAASAVVLGAALLSQYWGGLAPCELCLLQRWPWGVAITISLVTVLAGGRGALPWVAAVLALVFAASHFPGIRQFTAFYLRWRVRALAYLMLLTDRYPPFGDSAYPAELTIVDPAARDRLSVGFRLFLAIPHFIVLTFLGLAWWITAIIGWLFVLFTAAYPAGLFEFGVGMLRWFLRVEAYLLLMIDEYPPFTLAP